MSMERKKKESLWTLFAGKTFARRWSVGAVTAAAATVVQMATTKKHSVLNSISLLATATRCRQINVRVAYTIRVN